MPSGGKRAGAGRKPILEFMDRLWIGSLCQEKWRDVCKKAETAAIAEHQSRMPEVSKMQAETRRISHDANKQAWIEAEAKPKAEYPNASDREVIGHARNIVDVLATDLRKKWIEETYSEEGYELQENADFERRELAGVDADEPDEVVPMMWHIPVPRPKGPWPSIIKEVVLEAKAKFPDARITERFVKECLNEIRKFDSETAYNPDLT
jgi:hypothetical protein